MLLDIVTAWKGLFAGEGAYFMAIVKAHTGFAKWVFFKRRLSTMPVSRSSALNGWLNKSIVWAYLCGAKENFLKL